MTGVNMAMKTGAASPNSTADMPLWSRTSVPIHARRGRGVTTLLSSDEHLCGDEAQSRHSISRAPTTWRFIEHAVSSLTGHEQNWLIGCYCDVDSFLEFGAGRE